MRDRERKTISAIITPVEQGKTRQAGTNPVEATSTSPLETTAEQEALLLKTIREIAGSLGCVVEMETHHKTRQ